MVNCLLGSKTKKVRLKPNSRDRISGKRKAREAQAQATPTAEGQDIYGQITLTSFAIKRSTIVSISLDKIIKLLPN